MTRTRSDTRHRLAADHLVLVAIAALLILAGVMRREFLGDGVRHLPAILSSRLQPGEPRWLLFSPLANVWIRVLLAIGVAGDAESTLRALLVLSIASGIVFLVALRAWLRSECGDTSRCAAALFLAGSCAPFLILFSDVAEPPVAAAIAAAGLAYARVCRDDIQQGARAAYGAVAAIAIASLIYQGVILALGMLPLVVSTKTIARRRLVLATGIAIVAVMTAMVAVEVGKGASAIAAAATVVRGEHNPLMRSMMAAVSPLKYGAAVLAGPPQGIVALDSYGGLWALQSSVSSGDRTAVVNGVLLFVGLVVTGVLFLRGVRDRQWWVLAAAGVLLALPVIRNQQYAYVKFYVLWPIPVALLALCCQSRTIFAAAAIVLAANGWLLTEQIQRGREHYRHARAAFASASSSTCWFTSGWSPPFAYLWPGAATPILGTLGTGTDPDVQRAELTAALRRCFCESDAVWTDTTTRDGKVVRSVADHFEYSRIDFASVLIDPNEAGGNPVPDIWVYSAAARDRACDALVFRLKPEATRK